MTLADIYDFIHAIDRSGWRPINNFPALVVPEQLYEPLLHEFITKYPDAKECIPANKAYFVCRGIIIINEELLVSPLCDFG